MRNTIEGVNEVSTMKGKNNKVKEDDHKIPIEEVAVLVDDNNNNKDAWERTTTYKDDDDAITTTLICPPIFCHSYNRWEEWIEEMREKESGVRAYGGGRGNDRQTQDRSNLSYKKKGNFIRTNRKKKKKILFRRFAHYLFGPINKYLY